MIRPKLHHVTMKTSHLDEMIAWYEKVIGPKVQFRDQVAAWTTNDTANHRIAFLAVPALLMIRRRSATMACTIQPLSTTASML